MLRVISELRPRWVLAENVRGAVNLALDTVKMGMEGEGYKVWPFVIPASAFGAPHKRERLFVVGAREDVANAHERRLQEAWPKFETTGITRDYLQGIADGLMWATPNTTDYLPQRSVEALLAMHERARKGRSRPSNLREQVDEEIMALWPTPRAGNPGSRKPGTGGKVLEEEAKKAEMRLWPTPKAQNANSPGIHGTGGQDLQTEVANRHEGQLNPDWVEILMNFPIGWTNLEMDEPEPWPGWPAPMGVKLWATPAAWDCQGASGGGMGRSLRTDIHNIKNGLTEAGQFPYEPPRVAKGIKNRADRIKCLGNAVVPQQVYPILKAIAEIERCSE